MNAHHFTIRQLLTHHELPMMNKTTKCESRTHMTSAEKRKVDETAKELRASLPIAASSHASAGADASVQRGSTDSWKGAHVGTTADMGLGWSDCGPPEAGGGGAANAVTLTGYLRQLDGMSMDTKCDHARFCRVDRTYQSEQARITLSVDRSGVRDAVVSALQQLGEARKYGRAPPTQLARELQQWLDTLFDK